MKLSLPNYYVIHYIINDAETPLSECWWSQTAYHRWYSHVVFCSHRCLWVVYTVACIVFFEWWPAMFFCAKYIWLGVFTRYHWAGCIFDNPSDVFFGADAALYFSRAESCMNVFFDAKLSWVRFLMVKLEWACFFARLNYLTLCMPYSRWDNYPQIWGVWSDRRELECRT